MGDKQGRRLVTFWAGGRVKKKAAKGLETPTEERAEGAYRKGGKVKVKVVHKAKGGMPGAVAGAKHRAAMGMMPPANPMEGRMDTGIVARKPRGRRALPAMGGMLGPLG